jgi:hypothetical protein
MTPLMRPTMAPSACGPPVDEPISRMRGGTEGSGRSLKLTDSGAVSGLGTRRKPAPAA